MKIMILGKDAKNSGVVYLLPVKGRGDYQIVDFRGGGGGKVWPEHYQSKRKAIAVLTDMRKAGDIEDFYNVTAG